MGKVEIKRIWKLSNVWRWRGGAQDVYRKFQNTNNSKTSSVYFAVPANSDLFSHNFCLFNSQRGSLWVGSEEVQHCICTLGAIVVHTWDYVIRWYESHELSQFSEAAVFAVWNFVPEYKQGPGQDLITMGANQLLKATS